MRRDPAVVTAVPLLLVAVLVVGPLSPAGSDAGPQFPPPGFHQTVVFGQPVAPPNVVHAPVELAKAFGFLDRFNVDLDVKDFEGSTRALTAAIAGGVQIGLIDCQVAYGNGVPIVAFYAPAPRMEFVLVARDRTSRARSWGCRAPRAGSSTG